MSRADSPARQRALKRSRIEQERAAAIGRAAPPLEPSQALTNRPPGAATERTDRRHYPAPDPDAETPRRMIGYVRVSTEEQAEFRNGLDAQTHALTQVAGERGWSLRVFPDEGKSGKDVPPGLQKALEWLAMGRAEGLVVTKLDRLSRSIPHAANIVRQAQDQEWDLVVLDPEIDFTKPTGRFQANILLAVAELERDMVSQRTREALAAKQSRGERVGRKSKVPPWVVDLIL